MLYSLYMHRLRKRLQGRPRPRHVAMIIDGNRRWARQLGHPDAAHGHRAGAAKMVEFLSWCDREGIELVTLYLLSTDNLRGRSPEELDALVEIIADLARRLGEEPRWRVQHVGAPEVLPTALRDTLREVQEATGGHRGLHINLAVGYGGRNEIVDAVRAFLRKAEEQGEGPGRLAERITADAIAEHLYTGGQPDPDLVIRTSGEQRLSDFMLWQSAHSEFYFVEALGPDLREVDFLRALRDYAGRQRRYGQ